MAIAPQCLRRRARTDALSLGAELKEALTASSAACLSAGSNVRSCAMSAGKESEWLLALIASCADDSVFDLSGRSASPHTSQDLSWSSMTYHRSAMGGSESKQRAFRGLYCLPENELLPTGKKVA